MKNLKNILAFTILFMGLQNFAQNYNSDGIYTTKFGNISVTTEYSLEFPDGNITYGDYRENGTITGSIVGSTNSEEFKGNFFNGSSLGKFLFRPMKSGDILKQSFKNPVDKFIGYWGYNSVNPLSNNEADRWDAERTKIGVANVKNVTNVWSGKWNTTDGAMHLSQTSNKTTGRYKGVGTVTATYNPTTRLLKGTFLNQNNNKTGYLEFYFEGNTFKGKWGWTTAMTEGNWDGTKDVKNNKELSKMVVAANSATTKYVVSAISISASNDDNYGFFGCKLYKVTQNNRELIGSFGNKLSDFYNTTENSNNLLGKKQNFPNSPEYFREFNLNNSDLSNNQVKYELEIYSHMKAKTTGKNMNYGFKKEIFRLDQIKLGEIIIMNSYADGATIFGQGACTINFKVTKI